jgi:hypothetical protein
MKNVSPERETGCWNRKMIPEPEVERIPHLKELEKGGGGRERGRNLFAGVIKGFLK